MGEAGAGISLLLHGLQSAINVGAVLRMAESFGIGVDIWDEAGLFADPAKRTRIADFACGAVHRGAFRLLVDQPMAHGTAVRQIATCLTDDAVALTDFRFQPGDRIAIGNEYDGLPRTFIAAADVRLRIPMANVWTPKIPSSNPIDPHRPTRDPADGAPVLSAAMAAAIVSYVAFSQSLAHRPTA